MKAKAGISPNIHGARGLLSLMIFIHHTCNSKLAMFDAPAIAWLQHNGGQAMKMGVEMFFGISGIVIVGSIPRARSFTSFVWDRISRIYPVLWASLFVIIALLASGRSDRHFPHPVDLVANFFTPPPFLDIPLIHPAAWSLGYEMTFYVIAGAAWFVGQAGRRTVMWALIGLGIGLTFFYPAASLMLSGVLIARKYAPPAWVQRWSRFATVNFLLFLISWQMMDFHVDGLFNLSPAELPIATWLTLLPAALLMWVIGSVALVGMADGHGPLGHLLRTRMMQWLGSISFSFYIWHPIALSVVKGGLAPLGVFDAVGQWAQPVLGLLAIGPTLLVSHFSQRWLEINATMWMRRIGPDGARAKVPVAPTATDG